MSNHVPTNLTPTEKDHAQTTYAKLTKEELEKKEAELKVKQQNLQNSLQPTINMMASLYEELANDPALQDVSVDTPVQNDVPPIVEIQPQSTDEFPSGDNPDAITSVTTENDTTLDSLTVSPFLPPLAQEVPIPKEQELPPPETNTETTSLLGNTGSSDQTPKKKSSVTCWCCCWPIRSTKNDDVDNPKSQNYNTLQ